MRCVGVYWFLCDRVNALYNADSGTTHGAVMSQGSAAERFDRIAANYATSEVHRNSPSIVLLHELLGEATDLAVCDIACGAGHLALSFAGRANRIVGVDAAPNMLIVFKQLAAQRHLAVETLQARAENVPLPEDSFDVVASRLAPHHFSDVAAAVREMTRLAKPGGAVAVIDLQGSADPAVDEINHRIEMLHDPTHVRSYTAARWRSLFEDCGLQRIVQRSDLREIPAGITLHRWCEIASSGAEAEAQVEKMLGSANESTRDALGVANSAEGFRLTIPTVLTFGRKG
jgi:ubiquinone/menaquinone biosynthesis C-methylase UbiE